MGTKHKAVSDELDTDIPRANGPTNHGSPGLKGPHELLQLDLIAAHSPEVNLRDYFSSERFIHDDLLLVAERIVEKLRGIVRANGSSAAYALTWPAEVVRGDDGASIDQLCVALLEEIPQEKRREAIIGMVQKTKAYALLFVEQREQALVVQFESPHGARSWRLPIERRGDTWALGPAEIRTDADCVGVIWMSKRGTA
jgi:hypothetical protein